MSCRILTSFAMANHGSTFMHWLRSELMKSLGLYDIDAVYVDSIVSRSIDDRATVAPDTRAHMRSPTGAMPIGAMREDWNALYQAAMRQAQLMLFCYTDEFRDRPVVPAGMGPVHRSEGGASCRSTATRADTGIHHRCMHAAWESW
ncbi:hypothetical protein [Xanthomonas euvesicatoria]|uniref:hypothetical protein n=1 Tax=Xanthomonas euvesicatoria TaxID=456327 RepID=UPI003A103041